MKAQKKPNSQTLKTIEEEKKIIFYDKYALEATRKRTAGLEELKEDSFNE